jgi:hypothetical protein
MHAHAAALEAGGEPGEALDRTLDEVVSPLEAVASAVHALPLQHRLHAETERLALSVALDRLDRAIGTPTDPRAQSAGTSIDRILEALCRTWLRTDARDRRGRIAAWLRSDRMG